VKLEETADMCAVNGGMLTISDARAAPCAAKLALRGAKFP
jgi:hypothetical protein